MRDAVASLQARPGTYLLWLVADTQQSVRIGKLGEMAVEPGIYAYVGSAHGPGGVKARVQRHARDDKTLHWHIDYLRQVTRLVQVWYVHDETRRECTWAEAMASLPHTCVPMHGLGASDCDCASHLFYQPQAPGREAFEHAVHQQAPGHPAIESIAACSGA